MNPLKKFKTINNLYNTQNDTEQIKKVPVITKNEILDMYENIDFKKCDLYQYHETSGTSGEPIPIWLSRNDFFTYVEEMSRNDVNFSCDDIALIRFPYALSVPAHTLSRAIHNKKGCVIHAGISDKNCNYLKIIEIIKKCRVTIIGCNVNEAFVIGHIFKKLNVDISKELRVRAICVAGELLSRYRRKRLEQLWGCDVYEFYGTTELGNLGTSDKLGNMILDSEDFSFDVINIQNDVGELCVTTLKKELLPLVKYNTEDLVQIVKSSTCKGYEIVLHGRKIDSIRNENEIITFRNLQDAFLCMPSDIIGDFWRIVKNNEEKITIFAESKLYNDVDTKTINLNLNIKYELQLKPVGSISNIENKLREKNSYSKPKYIF